MPTEGQIHQQPGEGGWIVGRLGSAGRVVPAYLDHQSLEAVFAVDMEALKQFGIFEGIKADGTGQLVLQLL